MLCLEKFANLLLAGFAMLDMSTPDQNDLYNLALNENEFGFPDGEFIAKYVACNFI